MAKYLLVMFVLFLLSCNGGRSSKLISFEGNYPADTVYIHDTIVKESGIERTKIASMLDASIKPYLIQYYKAGWIDATNKLIDLYNSERFNTENVYSARDKYWRKIENQVNSK